jgi:hypothetical protein
MAKPKTPKSPKNANIEDNGAELNAARPTPPTDAVDFASLWLDPGLGDGITDTGFHSIVVGKPKNFFRTVSDVAYRRRTEIYVHKPEGLIEEQHYIIAPSMRGRIEEARPCTLVTVIYRDGTPRLWSIPSPRDGERDNEAWMSARKAAKVGLSTWTKLVWANRSYQTRDAQPGYAPDPDFDKLKLPPFDELVALGFGENGVIRDTDHPIYRDLFGMGQVKSGDTNDDF